MKKTFILMTLLLSCLITLAGDLSKDLIWQMGGNAPIDTSIKLNVNAEWIATPGFGNGLEFFGDGSWASVPNFPANKIGEDVTISFFFKCYDLIPKDKEKTCGAIFSYKYEWLGRVYKGGSVFGGMCNKKGELKGIFSSIKIEPQKWYHFALVWSSKNNNFSSYIDGVRAGVRSDNITPLKKLSSDKQFAFGQDPDGSYFNGVVADFRIYNRPLSSKEVKKLASKTDIPFTAKPNYPSLYAFITEAISGNPIIPDSRIDAKFLGKTIKFTATPGEYESASFVLRPTTDFKDVTFELSDLKGTAGVIPASALDLKLVKCWYQGPAAWRNEAPGKYPNVMVPELLLNDYNLVKVDEKTEKNFLRHGKGSKVSYEDVSGRKDNNNFWQKNMTIAEYPVYDAATLQALPLNTNRNQQFFLTLHAPENAKAGIYTGSISVKSKSDELAKLAVEVEILPFKLVEARTYYNLEKPYMTSVYYNTNLQEEDQGGITAYHRNSSQIRNELKNLIAHGVMYPTCLQLNTGDISTPKYQKLLRKMLRLRKEAGMPNKPIHLISNHKINLPDSLPATPEGLQKLTDRAIMIMNLVEEELGHRDVYFYGVDEAKGDVMKAQVPFFKAIQKAGAKVFSAGYSEKIVPPGNFAAIGKVQDLLICAAYSTREEAAKWHSVGHEIWCYAYPQAGNENPEIFRRNFGLITYKANYDGSATFCYYMAFGHPWNDFDSTIQRDLNFVYPTADGVVDTMAFEGYREGYDDIRYATTLKFECQEAKLSSNPVRVAAAKEAEDFLEKRDVFLKDLIETRSLIIKRILKLRKLAGKGNK
ncbi:MAG: LamG domain-containing protein [Lentisphaeria bacterium]